MEPLHLRLLKLIFRHDRCVEKVNSTRKRRGSLVKGVKKHSLAHFGDETEATRNLNCKNQLTEK